MSVNKCPDCGRFSSGSWESGENQNASVSWGGTCTVHGEWVDFT